MSEEQYIYLVFCVLAFIFGACFGSFSNVLIYRIPAGESIVKGASHCTSCGKKIRFYDNIPLLSYLILGGKCRDCKAPISPRYVIVEAINALLWLGFALLSPIIGYPYAIFAMLFSTALIAIGFIDYKTGIIPDSFNIFIAILAVAACFLDKYVDYKFRLFGLAFGAVFFGLFYFLSKLVFKREGLGFGDVKLMASSCFFLGLKGGFFATLIASITAAVVLSIANSKSEEKQKEYPFAPFLAIGCIISAFVGEILINLYLSIF